jgi:hypothetical protein
MVICSPVSYSLRVSILVEIAEKAHVSVEGVLRVLTREPVSDAIQERVLAVLDDLDPEQNRVLQRFALAALHDALPRPEGSDDVAADAPAPARADLAAASEPVARPPVAGVETAHLVELRSVLEELADAVRDLRRETDTERRERVDDLAVLIELISSGWQGLDRRLGRLERQLGRLEAVRAEPTPAARPDAAAQPSPEAAAPPPPAPVPEQRVRRKRDRLPLAAAAALAGLVIASFAVLQFVAGESRLTGVSTIDTVVVEPTASTPAEATPEARTTPRATTPPATPARTEETTPPTTSAVAGTRTTQSPSTPATTTTGAEGDSGGFRPTRDWAWAPAARADYYAVQFLRGGTNVYRTTTDRTRLTLPRSVVFRPGSYRWVVRPGFGSPSANRLGPPLVDSPFTVQ